MTGANKYYVWDGLEPDKWASVWLIKQRIDPQAEIIVTPVGAEVSDAKGIGTPNGAYGRVQGKSTFENIVLSLNKTSDRGLMALGSIIHELEISTWSRQGPLTSIVEQQFRALQEKYNRVDVPLDCYAGFFEALYQSLRQQGDSDIEALGRRLDPERVCHATPENLAIRGDRLVHEYPVEYVLQMIATDKRVIFVDTREDSEYSEGHIPGSINIKLREVNPDTVRQLDGADLVISYCVKDFRGYEVAMALAHNGVKNSGIMKPYGIRGWRDIGLPVATDTVPDSVALETLKQCAIKGQCEDPAG